MNGIVYGIPGPSSRFLPALVSIRSLRKYYNGPITVITDVTGGFVKWLRNLDINVIYDRVTYPRFYGVINDLSPYDNTFLVPPNSMFFKNIDHIWDGLDQYDIVADSTITAKEDLENIKMVSELAYEMTAEYVDDSISLFNLDLLIFNKKSNEFFKSYEEEFLKIGHGSMTRSIVKTGLQRGGLPIEYLRCDENSFDSAARTIDYNDHISFVIVKGAEMFKFFIKYQKDIFDECMTYGNVGEIPEAVESLLFQ